MLAQQGLPANLDAERGLLGAILLNNSLYDEVGPLLRDQDFALPAHQRIYRAMSEMRGKNQAMDLVTLTDLLQQRGELDAVGGPGQIAELIAGLPVLDSAEHYAKIVRDKALLRRLIQRASQIIATAYASPDEAEAVLTEAEQGILEVGEQTLQGNLRSLAEYTPAAMATLEMLSKRDQHVTGVPTGFEALDDYTSGLQPSDLIILAARPSVGKTSFALSLALNAARKGKAVALFSLEMSAEQLFFRLLSMESHVDLQKLRTGRVPPSKKSAVSLAFQRLEQMPMYIDDCPQLSVVEMGAKLRRLQRTRGLDMALVDYLQLMRGAGRFENRNQEVSSISRGLKALAKELRAPLVALSQLSRASEKRGKDTEPILSDLRESGSIEQDADLVLFLHRSVLPRPDDQDAQSKAKLIIAKQRNGPTESLFLTFLRQEAQFANATQAYSEGDIHG